MNFSIEINKKQKVGSAQDFTLRFEVWRKKTARKEAKPAH